MNYANADTLARIVKMRRSEKVRAWESFFIQTQQTNTTVDTPRVDNLPNINLSFTQAIFR